MKHCLASLLLLLPLSASAEVNFSLLATSDYVLRGVSLSNGKPALQLGADGEFSHGFFAGAWLSNVELPGPDSPEAELYSYVGWGTELNDKWRCSFDVARFSYLGTDTPEDYDLNEYSAALNYTNYGFKVIFSDDYLAIGGKALYYELSGQWALSDTLTLRSLVGHYDVKNFSKRFNLADDHYHYLRLGLDYTWQALTFSLDGYANSSEAESIYGDTGKSRLVASVLFSF